MKRSRFSCVLVLFAASTLFADTPKTADSGMPESLLTGDEVRQLMQDRNYPEALKAINEAMMTPEARRDYLNYLKGRVFFLQKKYDLSAFQFDAVQKEFPQSDWARHARFGKALALSRKGDFQSAETIMRTEAEYLLSADWKQQIADIYLEFADANFKPPKDDRKPDYEKALKFYEKALEAIQKPEKRLEVELLAAECRQKLGQMKEAAELYEKFIKDHPQSALDVDARFFLGECRMAQGDSRLARRTWQDLIANHADSPSSRIAEAYYQISKTWGMPKPANDEELNLGTAALEAFIEHFPKHKLAGQAQLEIAEGNIAREHYDEAAKRLTQFLADERNVESEQIPDARDMLGRCFQLQKKYPEALAVWREYLVKHPAHKAWSSVQREIINTEYLAAQEKLEAKDFDAANKLFADFLAKYPLDRRNPEILLAMNRNACEEEKWDEAIAGWRRLVSKYPKSDAASLAQFSIAETLEKKLGKLEEALEEYRKVTWGASQGIAMSAIYRFTSPEMNIATERIFRSNETPKLKLTTRNVESVTVRAYKVDMETYFRKMHLVSGVESLDIALIDPDKTFEYKVPKYEKYREFENEIEVPLPGDARAGVTAVTVSGKTLEATTVVIQSDLDVIVKSSRDEVFVFAQNMVTGKPSADARLLISNGNKVFAEETTGKDGVFQKSYPELKETGDVRVFAVSEGNIASNVVDLQYVQAAQGIADKGYLYTDRPAYRAGQPVHIRGCIRHAADDAYEIEKEKKFTLDVFDSQNRLLHQQPVELSEFGSFHLNFLLPETSPQGKYRVSVHDDEGQNYQGEFLVREYKLEPMQLTVDAPRHVYYRGEEIEGVIRAAYSYGAPLAGCEIRYRLADQREYAAMTDAKGEVHFKLPTRDFGESQVLTLSAQLPERNLQTKMNYFLAVQEYSIVVNTVRPIYLAGENFEAAVETRDAEGKPIAAELTLKVHEDITVAGKPGKRLVEEHPLDTAADGKVRKMLKLEKGGSYTLSVEGIDRFKNPVSGKYAVKISDDKDACRLRILAESSVFKVGDTATVNLHWRESPALALVTFQGAKILNYKLVELKNGPNEFKFPVTALLAPNFDLAVSVMNDPRPTPAPKGEEAKTPIIRFHEAFMPMIVIRELQVKLVAKRQGKEIDPKDAPRPGEEIEVEVITTDSQGKPVSAEVSLAMVERSLMRQYGESIESIQAFFQGLNRETAVRTASSITFAYKPNTQPINQRLLAEEERQEILRAEEQSRKEQEKHYPAAPPATPAADNPFGDKPDEAIELGEPEMETGAAEEAAKAGYGGLFGHGPGKPGRGHGAGMGRAGAISKHAIEKSKILTEEIEEEYLGAPAEVEVNFLETSDRKPGSNNNFALPTAGEIAALVAQNRGQVMVLKSDGSMQMLNLPADAPIPANWAAEADIAALLPGLELPETGYWNPAVVTDEEGKATVRITLPEQSTAWNLVAKGITAETLAGETTDDLVVKKELFGQLKLPLAFTDGDEAEIPASIHNGVVAEGQIDVTLKTAVGGRTIEEKKTIDVKAKGIHEVVFKVKLDRPETTQEDMLQTGTPDVRAAFELTVVAHAPPGEQGKEIAKDVLRQSVPVQPYGMPVFFTASGSATSDATAWLEVSQEMPLQRPSLQILVGPTVEESLLDIVLAPAPWCQRESGRIASGLDTVTSDLMAALGLQKIIAAAPDAGDSRAQSLDVRIRSAIGLLVTSQNSDGGWSWTAHGGNDRFETARAVWALSLAKKAGFQVPDDCYNKALARLQADHSAAANTDYEAKAILLHALSTAGKGDFALANRLYRERPALSAAALAHLALAFIEMDRKQTAGELLDVLAQRNLDDTASRRKTELGSLPCSHSPIELRALYALALEQVAPKSDKAKALVDWLLAHRTGYRWSPDKATGPASLALCRWFAESRFEGERYKLAVSVNDAEAKVLDIDPAAGTQVIDVPEALLKKEGKQRIGFQISGRGRYAYQCIMGGFVPAEKLKNTSENWEIKRSYEPALLEVDGREIRRGFGILQDNVAAFKNPLTQLPVGRRGIVELTVARKNIPVNTPEEQLEYLVVTEPIPEGTGVIEQSVNGGFERFEIAPGTITFFVGNRRHVDPIRYELRGYIPGVYRAAPTVVRNAHRPEQLAVASPKSLTVLLLGGKSTDEYRLSPEELYELGKLYFEKKDFKTAAGHLTELFQMRNLHPSNYKHAVQMLLDIHLEIGPPKEIVHYFEIVKEKWPEVEIPFANIVKVGAAYHEMGEFERSFLIFRATVESSFNREIGVAGFLESQGEFARSVEVMDRLLREYPPEGYAAAAHYALAQHVYAKAPDAAASDDLRRRKLNRVDLTSRAWTMLENFLTAYPDDPAADQAAFAAANALLEMKSYKEAAAACDRYARRYPKSELLDTYWYVIGYCRFAAGENEAALEMCRKVAEAKRTDPATGREAESRNKWRAIYILGQVYHSLGRAAEAIGEYRRVEDRFADAKQSIEYFLRKAIDLPEITTLKTGDPTEVELKFRNIATCDVRVYRIDLMKFGLLKRNLGGIAQINLAGIRPLHEETVKLGDGKDYRDRIQKLALPLKEEGAYLVVCRGEDLHASGLALVTPLAVEVQEDPASGQVRTTVKNTVKDAYLHDVNVKVIGSGNYDFVSGTTDLRGVFVANDIQGSATVIAESGGSRYAFFRSPNFLPRNIQAKGAELASRAGMSKNFEEALKSPTFMDFKETPLSKVVDHLRNLHGIEIQLDTRALNDLGVTPDTAVTKHLKDISLRSALRLLLKDLGLTYIFRDEVLMITTPEEAECNQTTQIYPVGDLVACQDTDGVASCDFDSLIDLLAKTVKPTSWDDVGGPGSVQPFEPGQALVVTQTLEVHGAIEELLARFRKEMKEQGLEGKVRIIPKVDPEAMQGMGGMGGMGAGMGGGMGGMGTFGGNAGRAPAASRPRPAGASAPMKKADLLEGLNDANKEFQGKQGQKLQKMYENKNEGVGAGGAF